MRTTLNLKDAVKFLTALQNTDITIENICFRIPSLKTFSELWVEFRKRNNALVVTCLYMGKEGRGSNILESLIDLKKNLEENNIAFPVKLEESC